ncbi:MAG: VOC family protein [Actinomycetota bacterium]|nr:VOC family protein [Actinomycetota bacterium]
MTGIGGFFFRARDPQALAHWYEEQLGIDKVPPSYDARPWWQEAGPTVWNPYSEVGPYFGGGDHAFILNFRVRNLDAMVEQLRGRGAEVEVDPELYPNGRFATTSDPEGNLIQLWEPTPDELKSRESHD